MIATLALIAYLSTVATAEPQPANDEEQLNATRALLPDIDCRTTAIYTEAMQPNMLDDILHGKSVCGVAAKEIKSLSQKLETLKKSKLQNISFATIEDFLQSAGQVCTETTTLLHLNPESHFCMFGVPRLDQPISHKVFELWRHGKLQDGSLCANGNPYKDERDSLLAYILGSGQTSKSWPQLKDKIANEGFIEIGADQRYVRALVSAGKQDGIDSAMPLPAFEIYFGQPRVNHQSKSLCKGIGANCVESEKPAHVPDAICISVLGFGP